MVKGKHIASTGRHAKHAAANTDIRRSSVCAHAHSVAAERRSVTRSASVIFWLFAAVALTSFLAIAIGMGFANAGNFDGIEATQETSSAAVSDASSHPLTPANESVALLSTTPYRDMTSAVADVQAQEEAARLAAEEAARKEEEAAIARAQKAQAASYAAGGVGVYDVDFSIGKEAFIAEWTARIDDYLAGSPLAGYGSTFATAAWNNGVDPRWSPAISNTESTKGQNCFAWHNAWGWTGGSWSSWTNAINAHVAGLANMYGFTISFANAKRYCPPNYSNWYSDTLNEMRKI